MFTQFGDTLRRSSNTTQFLTRKQAVIRTGLKLNEFRKLCIWKGVYPRVPKKNIGRTDQTYYHTKDVAYLCRDILIDKIKAENVWSRKHTHAIKKQEYKEAEEMLERKPDLPIAHLIRHRYPAFADALRDLDDHLNINALYASLPARPDQDISSQVVLEASLVMDDYHGIVSQSRALTKVFATVKGFYFEAVLQGVPVVWLEPHRFAQDLPEMVDFKVMGDFAEFSFRLMKFVNFRLHRELDLKVPQAAAEAVEENSEFAGESASPNLQAKVFEGLVFFVHREVQLARMLLVLVSGGGVVGWEGANSPFDATFPGITHHLVDRPPSHFSVETLAEANYVQPQWALDSFNLGMALPHFPYAPGKRPPPHLSPFVNDQEEVYVPAQRQILGAYKSQKLGLVPESSTTNDVSVALKEGTQDQVESMEGLTHLSFHQCLNFGGPAGQAAAAAC